jgi:hypothetical protein
MVWPFAEHVFIYMCIVHPKVYVRYFYVKLKNVHIYETTRLSKLHNNGYLHRYLMWYAKLTVTGPFRQTNQRLGDRRGGERGFTGYRAAHYWVLKRSITHETNTTHNRNPSPPPPPLRRHQRNQNVCVLLCTPPPWPPTTQVRLIWLAPCQDFVARWLGGGGGIAKIRLTEGNA